MRLRGLEFSGFACFDRQFVPICNGLNLLVGKNNAGKTAVLRGITCLRDIFVSSHGAPNEFVDYARTATPEAQFHIDVLFEPGQEWFFPQADKTWWETFARERHAVVAYRFWAMPARADVQIAFLGAELRTSGAPPLPVLTADPTLGARVYSTPLFDRWPPPLIDSPNIQNGGGVFYTPDGKQHLIPSPDVQQLKALLPLTTARYVAPHRRVLPFMEIRTAMQLPETAENLSLYLQTLIGRDRRAFQRIEQFVTAVFPEFSAVNPTSGVQDRVSLTLTRSDVGRNIPLSHSGTGVEQLLAIATFVVTAEPGAILLIDEPHSFLHPTAERLLLDFLAQDQQHKFVISTHSAIFINSIEPDRITYLEPPGRAFSFDKHDNRIAKILLDLGYRNSDVLFYDRLIAVEGKSDRVILPKLLLASGAFGPSAITNTGFPVMEGAAEDTRSLQLAVIRLERLITSIGKSNQPRLYLFDGDREPEDKRLLEGMQNIETHERIRAVFLPRVEIENYLLVPSALRASIVEEALAVDVNVNASVEEVKGRLEEIMHDGAHKDAFFSKREGDDPYRIVKGSLLLEKLYASFQNLTYDKDRSGRLIASHISKENQPALTELVDLFKTFF